MIHAHIIGQSQDAVWLRSKRDQLDCFFLRQAAG